MLGLESLILFVVVALMTLVVQFRWKRQRLYELAKNLPGHEGLSMIESLSLAARLSRKDYIPVMNKFIKDDSPITKIWLVSYFTILTKDPDFINKVFNLPQTYDKPKVFYQVFFMDNALTPLGGHTHKRHRKILNKAFGPSVLQHLPEVFNEKSKKILSKMEVKVDCGEFELTDYIGALSLESFGKINLNHEIEYFQSEIYDAVSRFMFTSVDTLLYTLIGLNKEILKLTNFGGSIGNIFGKFKQFVNDVIKSNYVYNDFGKNSIVDLLLNPKNGFNEQEIMEEIILITVASFATSTKTLSAVLMMIAMHKDVQQKLVEEIDKIFCQEEDTKFSTNFLHKFTYLDAVVKETMRLFPAIPIIGREASEEVEINGYLIPKETVILISLYAMHRDEKYWGDDAHLFKPERFEKKLKYPQAFVPFAGGRRICIGYRYAMMSMKIFLINFLRTYKVDCSQKYEDIETEMTLTLNFVNGYNVSIEKRHGEK